MADAPTRLRVRQVTPPEGKTHDEIYALLEALTEAIGTERLDEYGKPVGTGIVGRLMRLERDVQRRFATWDGWVKTATGAAMAATVLGGVLWWLLGERLGELLK